jgi:hypothetical protein
LTENELNTSIEEKEANEMIVSQYEKLKTH